MTSSKRNGFTLIELLVVVAMIAIILGAVSTSVSAAQNRARIQKATSDVKVITQAILAYENYNGKYSESDSFKLEPMGSFGKGGVDADADSLGFLLGNKEAAQSGGNIPALLMASLQSGSKMRDPWGTPYKVYIRQGTMLKPSKLSSLQMQYSLPNLYRLNAGERGGAWGDGGK